MVIEDAAFRHAVDLVDAGQVEALREYLAASPDLARRRVALKNEGYFSNPPLLAFIAENPVRQGSLPASIVEVARVILEAGVKDDKAAVNETLMLVASGRVPRECGVQVPLVDLLCDFGADPDDAMNGAIAHGEFEAVKALLGRGARRSLPAMAALGQSDEVARLLAPAGAEERHRALAVAVQFGHYGIVRLLLDEGEDPSRFNPSGFHAHSTPLHQAALAGHSEVVRLLVMHGAALDVKDSIWQGTPADWARHGGILPAELCHLLEVETK
ncbi:MAG TPA: ankyrin repeat domain-containing protein [Bryobacteraceae bacterium]|nr:ankyrin repeat domain-containing protein [Bryobacteraceae bacterium]